MTQVEQRSGASEFVQRLRAFELRCQANMPDIRCSVHLCLGQEGAPEVLHELLRSEDWLYSTHRSHGHYLAKGGSEERLWAEILGEAGGVNGGFSGSQSFCDPAINFHSTAIVGGLIGVATGTALALKLQGSPAISVCCIGDAATEQGVFWESLNFAVLHRLPIVYVCENNGLSVHAPIGARQCAPIAQRVAAFGIKTWRGLGNLSELRAVLERRRVPGFVEVECERECRHVSAMEDLRE